MELLEQYQQLCEEVQQLLMEESSMLKGGHLPSTELLQKKAEVLPQLDSVLNTLKSVEKLPEEDKKLAQKIQQKLMKMLLLDKENEKLLLSLQVSKQMDSSLNMGSSFAKNLYKKHTC